MPESFSYLNRVEYGALLDLLDGVEDPTTEELRIAEKIREIVAGMGKRSRGRRGGRGRRRPGFVASANAALDRYET